MILDEIGAGYRHGAPTTAWLSPGPAARRRTTSTAAALSSPRTMRAGRTGARGWHSSPTLPLQAEEWNGDLVFLHEAGPGPADRSATACRWPSWPACRPLWSLGPAQVLDRLESQKHTHAGLEDLPLFAASPRPAASRAFAAPARARSRPRWALSTSDGMGPREALDALYRLRRGCWPADDHPGSSSATPTARRHPAPPEPDWPLSDRRRPAGAGPDPGAAGAGLASMRWRPARSVRAVETLRPLCRGRGPPQIDVDEDLRELSLGGWLERDRRDSKRKKLCGACMPPTSTSSYRAARPAAPCLARFRAEKAQRGRPQILARRSRSGSHGGLFRPPACAAGRHASGRVLAAHPQPAPRSIFPTPAGPLRWTGEQSLDGSLRGAGRRIALPHRGYH